MTTSKNAYADLREAEERCRKIFESLNLGIWILDKDSLTTFVNPPMATMLGYTEEEMLGRHLLSFMDERGVEICKGHQRPGQEGVKKHEFELLRKDGGRIHALVGTSPVLDEADNYVGTIAGVLDISEHRMREEQLRDSEERLRIIFEYAPDGYYLSDMKGNFLYGNKAAERITGYSRDELIGRNFLKLGLLEASQIPKAAALLAMNRFHRPTGPDEFTLNRKDRTRVRVEIRTFPAKIKGRSVVLGIARDMAKRNEALEALRASEQRFRSLVEASSDMIWEVNASGTYTYVSPKIKDLLGYLPSEVVGKTPFDLMPADEAMRVRAIFQKIVAEKRPFTALENVNLSKDGRLRVLETSGVPAFDVYGEFLGYRGIDRDITERKRMEEEVARYSQHLEEMVKEKTAALMEAEQMAAIGKTAAMVGHDLRNPLQMMVNAVYLAERRLKQIKVGDEAADNEIRRVFETVRTQADYMNRIMADLRDFSRSPKPDAVEVDIDAVVREVLATLRIPADVTVMVSTQEGFPHIRADPAMMRRVLTNLATNALQAMPQGGQLEIDLKVEDGLALISVKDTGVGIPEDQLGLLFKPLFTTKPDGQGLGLVVCKRLVTAHGGTIVAKSKKGEGTTMIIRLPIQGRPLPDAGVWGSDAGRRNGEGHRGDPG